MSSPDSAPRPLNVSANDAQPVPTQTGNAPEHAPAPEHAHAPAPGVHHALNLRNLAVGVAAILFLVSLMGESVIGHIGHQLRGVAYFVGACAYGSEILYLTHFFRHKEPLHEMFMPYVFVVLYIILGLSYLKH